MNPRRELPIRCASCWRGHFFPPILRALSLLSLAVLPAGYALALQGDRVELQAGVTSLRDDNLFRVPGNGSAGPVVADTATQVNAGAHLNLPVSRQRYLANFDVTRTKYQRSSQLDYDGRDLGAAWQWQAGNDYSGDLGFSDSRTAAGFENFSERVQNLLTQDRAFGDLNYQLDARWQLQGGLSRIRLANSLAVRNVNDFNESDVFIGTQYKTPAENSLGLRVTRSRGTFPHPQIFAVPRLGVVQVDSGFRDLRLDGVTDWRLSGVSRVTGRVGYEQRRHDVLGQRDFSGITGALTYDWTPAAKTSASAVIRREIGALNDLTSAFVLVQGLSLRPRWVFSPKLYLQGTLDYAMLEYRGAPGVALGVAASERKDRLRTLAIELNYQATYNITLGLSMSRQQRSSNQMGLDYGATQISASIKAAL
jgi:exopolysaccharide biosynthesis operon protein EpsL